MALLNPESVSIKTEPESQEEGGGEMQNTYIDIDLLDVKKECLQCSETPLVASKWKGIMYKNMKC